MSRKNLEIQLSQQIQSFDTPKIELEQYQTPPRVAANLLHIAWTREHIEQRSVIDLCAGTGILGLGAAMLGAESTLVELDPDAFAILQENAGRLDEPVELVQADIFELDTDTQYDTALLNPPFGIQQRQVRDMDFVKKAAQLAEQIYSIHDGSEANQEQLPALFEKAGLEIIEAYIEEFPLSKSYPWHKMSQKLHHVLIIHAERS